MRVFFIRLLTTGLFFIIPYALLVSILSLEPRHFILTLAASALACGFWSALLLINKNTKLLSQAAIFQLQLLNAIHTQPHSINQPAGTELSETETKENAPTALSVTEQIELLNKLSKYSDMYSKDRKAKITDADYIWAIFITLALGLIVIAASIMNGGSFSSIFIPTFH
ncbi:hypothetical protein JHL22_10780 [Advenella sp. WQ 585]|uniref:Integral membrane protein n=1 Tax=Advenella mandrilli TaxID=2800330 RepID=A0ABS1EDM9_9BURK|nr:hypothetical protein [Advenella mandrilli]MBK1781704.1 hypothetical protein [Advenella mandrilli]